MCTPECICQNLGGLAFEEVIKAWKYVRHYTEKLQNLQVKLRDLGDLTETITREVREAIGRDDEIEVSVLHWQTDADRLKVDIEQLMGECTTKASISCIACSCPNIVWRYKFSKKAEEKMADADALIVKYNDFNHQISHPRSHYMENLQKLKDKLRDLDDCRETITREVSEANGRGDEIEVNVSHWLTDANSLKDDIEQLIRESANICSTECPCPNITWQYKFSKQAEEKMADADALIVKYNDFNHQISHPRSHYAENLQKLKDKLRDLDDCRETIIRKVSEANGRGDEIEVNVSHWQTDADSLLDHIEQFIRESTNICSTDITRQYEFSKQAEEKIADADELINKYNNFNHQISHPRPRPPELESLSDKNYVNFESRGSIFMNIMDELKDSNVNMIGVFGPGGVGKTTLVKEVGEQMRKDGTFKQVAMAAVSKDLNVKDVQSRLAASLNFKFKANVDDQVGRATELWNKLTNGDKYLIILDDIWQEVKMEAIGIPCTNEKKGCKVVLTSRKEDLLKITMKADKNFRIGELSEAEAMDLFKKKVGKTIESQPEIDSLAQEVCRKCKGLPVAINAIGAALEDKPYRTWKNALVKLERHMFPQIEGIEPSVWASLYVSYDMLRSSDAQSHSRSSDAQSRSDAQSCFLLCCLFHEDVEIPIDELMRLCIARSLLAQNPFTLDEARNAVHTVVDALKSASLLTTGSHENVVRIHDVIRDVGISIARDQGEAFLIDHGAPRWPPIPMNAPSYSAISLAFKDIKRLPSGLVYPQLHTLIVENSKLSDVEFPDNFFNRMTQLSVLEITRMRMRRLPSSLAKLAKLRMLYLNRCELADIAILKHLKSNLEVLGIRSSNIEALPPEIGQLTSLRVLDLQDCYELRVIPRGVISNLTGLEELYFPFNFAEWKATIDEQQDASNRDNVSLEDLRRLLNDGQLTTLQIHIPDVKLLPNDDLIFANLKGFKISVGSEFDCWERESSTTRTCMLKAKGIQLRNEFFSLVDKAEVLILEGIQLTVYPFRLSNKYLTVLTIEEFEFKYLFTPTTAKELLHLEKLEVRSCEIMEGIVEFEGQNDGKEIICEVKFSKLKELELTKLPNLKSFYAKKEKMGTTMESSSARARPLFNEKVIFPVLESLTIKGLDNIITIWDKQSIAIWQEQGYFCQLTDLEVKRCNKLMHVFPSNMHPLLKNLKKLEVKGCETMKGITEFEREIDEDGHRNEVAASPVLEVEHFEMVGVPKITEIRDKQPLLEPKKEVESLCKLMDIRIKNCGQLLYVFPSHMLPQNLQQLFIKKCDELEVIFSKELKEKEAINNDIIVFPRLKAVTLKTLRKLKSFYTDTQGFFFSHKVVFPVLKHMDLWRLDKITRIWDDQPLSEPEKEAKSFSELEDITVCGCDQLGYVLPSYMPPQLKNLQELTIGKCTKVKVIISNNPKEKEATNNNDTIRFPQLKKVLFCDLPNLKSFICSETQLFFSNKDTFPVLKNIYLGIDLNFLRNGTCTKESSCSNPRPKPTRKRRRPPQPLLQEGEINSVVQLDESGGGVTHFQSVEEGDSATSSTHILPQASGSESALTLPALEEIDHLDANLQIFQIGTCPQRPKPDCYRGQPQRPKPKHNRRHPPRPLLQEGNSSTQTRGRGPSLMNASWSMGKNPIKIVLNDRGQPVMPEASSLATNLGVLARDGSLLPLHYTDWRYVPAHYKKRVWEEIKAHTDANDSLERWFMQSLGRKWQGWKCDAKKQGYTPYNNDADRIAHRPSRVTEEQWRCLVYYWNDRDVKEKSANNKGYRSKQKLLHTSGRTPHYLVEQKDKDDGKNPTRIDTFIKTHTRKGGGEINEETSAIVNKLKALRCQDGSSSHPMSKGVIFSKMLVAKNNDQAPSQSSTERDREFMKMNPKVRNMKKFLEAMRYTDDTDDDSDELNVAPNENHPDASSAHREMTIGNNQASPEEINLAHRSQPEPTPFPRPNQQADSHHQCEPGSTAAADLAMWKQAEASRDARKTTRVTNKKRRTSQNGSN